MNPFQLAGDMAHLAAIVLLPFKLHVSRSAAGTSWFDLMGPNFVCHYWAACKITPYVMSAWFFLYIALFRQVVRSFIVVHST